MLPYIEQPAIPIGPVFIYPFGILVLAGILTGVWMVRARAAQRGLDREVALRFCAAMILCGLAGAHLLRLLMFEPRLLWSNPAALFDFREGGIYSFGGLFAGLAGGWLYLRSQKLSAAKMWQYLDVLAFVFPFAWAFGRAGCAIAHDHPGILSRSWLAVDFPGGGRYDLGLLEFLFMLPMAGLFLWMDRLPRPAGFYLGMFLTIYGPFRIWLDSLHEPAVPRFILTPDQTMGLLAACAGALILKTALRPPVNRAVL
jgi:phosphatidylglycerol---prolipoprotein diacylglyceryl transferase